GKATPDIMSQAGIECVDCHVVAGKVIKPNETICLNCHDSGYDKMALDWKNEVKKLIGEVKNLNTNYNGKDRDEILRVVSEIEKWSASGIHNYQLVTEVLQSIKRKLSSQAVSEKLKTY
ncbi:MAG: hypothetical protein ACK44H_09915, partial [Candidatus Kryptonium sp.]